MSDKDKQAYMKSIDEQFGKLVLTDPVIHAAVSLIMREALTESEALRVAVVQLSDMNRRHTNALHWLYARNALTIQQQAEFEKILSADDK